MQGGGYGGGGGYSGGGGGGGSGSYGGGGHSYGNNYNSGGGGGFGSGAYGGSAGGLGANLKNINWDLSKLPVFEKNFYIEHPDVRARNEAYSDEWRKREGITIIGRGIPKPVMTFIEASMPDYV